MIVRSADYKSAKLTKASTAACLPLPDAGQALGGEAGRSESPARPKHSSRTEDPDMSYGAYRTACRRPSKG
jgi:hypothetical protein